MAASSDAAATTGAARRSTSSCPPSILRTRTAMTDRLYYNDPYLREFDAVVLATSQRGGRLAVTLDRTAFYPTSGGQPFDTGTLGAFRVVDVADENGGTVEHILENTPSP